MNMVNQFYKAISSSAIDMAKSTHILEYVALSIFEGMGIQPLVGGMVHYIRTECYGSSFCTIICITVALVINSIK